MSNGKVAIPVGGRLLTIIMRGSGAPMQTMVAEEVAVEFLDWLKHEELGRSTLVESLYVDNVQSTLWIRREEVASASAIRATQIQAANLMPRGVQQ